MDYIRMGLTDLQVSRIGFGCAVMGGYDYGAVDDGDSIAAVKKSLEKGVNFFDTADVYGFGHAEEVLGKALGRKRNEVIIATKFGLKWDQSGRVSKDCSKKRVFQALDNSLRRLKVDAITLYQIHWPDNKTPIEETMEALLSCQKAGKIKHIGCSNFEIDLIKEYQKFGKLDSLQSSYNLLDRAVENEILSYCRNFKMAFFSHSSLARGLLSGEYNERHKFVGSDTRKSSHYFSDENMDKSQNLLCTMREIASKCGKTVPQVAIRWILDNPSVTGAIVGIKNIYQIEDCTGALGWKLSREDSNALSRQGGAMGGIQNEKIPNCY